MLALVYIDRLIGKGGFELSSLNVHRVIITSVLLAAKFFDDTYYNNAYFAKVGGVPCNEVNALELEMLFFIGFHLHVPTALYEKYFITLAGHCLVPPEHAPHTCDCRSYASMLAFDPEDIRHTGLRPDLLESASSAGGGSATTESATMGSFSSPSGISGGGSGMM